MSRTVEPLQAARRRRSVPASGCSRRANARA